MTEGIFKNSHYYKDYHKVVEAKIAPELWY